VKNKVRFVAIVCIVSLIFLVLPQGGIISSNVAQAQEGQEEKGAFKIDTASLGIGHIRYKFFRILEWICRNPILIPQIIK